MNKIERKSAVAVITGLLLLGVLTLATGIGSAQDISVPEAPAVPAVPFITVADVFNAPGWDDFNHHHLPAHVANLAGTYLVTNEGFFIPADVTIPVTPHQGKGRLATVEQFGSLLTVSFNDEDAKLNLFGSTAGNNIVLTQPGSAGSALGTVLDGGDKLALHSNLQVWDSNNNQLGYFIGTHVLTRVKDVGLDA
jgi:hypothetical protein